MPEPPDFERIAADILDGTVRALPLEAAIIAALRQAWNARGAADLVTLEAELTSMMGATASGPYVKTLDRALRGLDR